jgi:hypothetical protein
MNTAAARAGVAAALDQLKRTACATLAAGALLAAPAVAADNNIVR